jgi:hypothetical protein
MKSLDPQVLDPTKAFSPYDLEPIHDRCINCEARKKIIATITIDQRTGLRRFVVEIILVFL